MKNKIDPREQSRVFCDNVKRIRAERRLSKKDMAAIMKISVSSLNKIENGIMPGISCIVLCRICHYFGITLESLLE